MVDVVCIIKSRSHNDKRVQVYAIRRCTNPIVLDASDIRERQGHYIRAQSEEEAWQIMATRYPEESTLGFTVEEWAGGDVTVEIKRDDEGNIIE